MANRAALRRALPEHNLFAITANGLLQRNADNTMPFRQDSNFWYLTGIDEPDVVLVMDGDDEYLIVPPRDDVRAAFDGEINSNALSTLSGVKTILLEDEGWKKLEAAVKKHKHFATCDTPPAYEQRMGMYMNPSRARVIDRLKEADNAGLHDVRPALMQLRARKQPVEIKAIQQAIDTTIDSLLAVSDTKQRATYAYEYEIEADLTAAFKRHQGSGHAYTPIVAGGANACVLHYITNDSVLNDNELVLLDVGAEVSNYAADITRTMGFKGQPTARQREVHDAVVAIQDYALSLLKPGTMLQEYEQAVETFTGKKLQELGVIKTADKQTIRKYYPHSASHFLGLDVHDVGDYSEPLEAGMVLTCEPGIYLPEEGIGVRIEDDILITENGNDVLSRRLPRTIS